MKSPKHGPKFFVVLLCALIVLAGCGTGTTSDSDDEGHRFATERRPTVEPTATSETAVEASSVIPTPEPTIPPEEALNVRGAPQFVYLLINGELQVYDSVARTFQPLNLPPEMSILDYASSPTGDRAGVLGLLDTGVVVQFFGADGEPLGEPTVIPLAYRPQPQASPVATQSATPVGTTTSAQLHVSWIPQGNAVVVAGPGVMHRVSMSGVIMPISRAGVAGTVVEALWSPMDSQVAILTQMMDGHQGVFMLDSGHAEATELDTLHIQSGQSLSNLQWLPNGLGLIVVVGTQSNGELMNGQLFVDRFDGMAPELIATSGQGGPTATISHAVVSPDGHSVAYAVMVRDLNEWHLHSLWVKPLRGGPAYQVSVESNAPVTNILWTAEGLVWQQDDGAITVVDGSLTPRTPGEEPVATPVASPESTPVIEATPQG